MASTTLPAGIPAQITQLSGAAMVRHADGSQTLATQGLSLHFGDTLITQPGAKAVMMLAEGEATCGGVDGDAFAVDETVLDFFSDAQDFEAAELEMKEFLTALLEGDLLDGEEATAAGPGEGVDMGQLGSQDSNGFNSPDNAIGSRTYNANDVAEKYSSNNSQFDYTNAYGNGPRFVLATEYFDGQTSIVVSEDNWYRLSLQVLNRNNLALFDRPYQDDVSIVLNNGSIIPVEAQGDPLGPLGIPYDIYYNANENSDFRDSNNNVVANIFYNGESYTYADFLAGVEGAPAPTSFANGVEGILYLLSRPDDNVPEETVLLNFFIVDVLVGGVSILDEVEIEGDTNVTIVDDVNIVLQADYTDENGNVVPEAEATHFTVNAYYEDGTEVRIPLSQYQGGVERVEVANYAERIPEGDTGFEIGVPYELIFDDETGLPAPLPEEDVIKIVTEAEDSVVVTGSATGSGSEIAGSITYTFTVDVAPPDGTTVPFTATLANGETLSFALTGPATSADVTAYWGGVAGEFPQLSINGDGAEASLAITSIDAEAGFNFSDFWENVSDSINPITLTLSEDNNTPPVINEATPTTYATNTTPSTDDDDETTEDTGTQVGGTIIGSDADDDELTYSVTPGDSLAGTYGNFVLNPNGTWTYNLATEPVDDADSTQWDALQALDDGDVETETLSVRVTDGNGGTDDASITVQVNGVNDLAVTAAGYDLAETATENGAAVNGTVAHTDVDDTLTYALAEDASLTGTYGDFTLNTTSGAWTYTQATSGDQFTALQALDTGDAPEETLNVVISGDNTAIAQAIVVTVNGVNDLAVTAAGYDLAETATENGAAVNGTVAHTDVDDTLTYALAEDASLTGTYGDFTLNTTSGAWTYTQATSGDQFTALQALDTGDAPEETLNVVISGDNTAIAQAIVVTVNGVNDLAVTAAGYDLAETATENGAAVNGTVAHTDVDDTLTYALAEDASLTGTYGDFTLNTTSGAWTYTQATSGDQFTALQALDTGDAPEETLNVVISGDNTAIAQAIVVTVNGVNDQPTISVTKTDPTEDSTTTSTVVGQVSASADEETATGDLTYTVATTGDTVYYVMSGTNVLLNDAGVALVNAGGTLPAFTVTVNDGSGVSNSTNSASATPVVQIVNDQPTISVTKTDPTEDSTTTSTVVGQVSASADEETATGDLTYTVATTGDTVYYVMSGTNVLLNDAGVALVNAGGTLPAFTVTVNDGSGVSNSTNSASATPVVQIVNDQPTISVTKTDPTEDSTTTSTVVGQVSASADEETATGDLTYTVATTGDTVYYVMSGTNVLLNDAGVALVNAGGTLPAFTVTVNDGSGVSNSTNSASATPVVQIVNDQPTISVTKTDPTEDSTTTSTVVGQVSASADEETATGDLTYTVATTGDTVYYVMSGTNVLLNDAGVALVNAGGTLPAFTVTVNDGSGVSNSTNSASATPVVQIVNDQPTISVTKTDPTEDSTTTSTVVGQVSASADEETATGDLTYTVATTGDTVYYVMSGTNVLLNDAGVALVNAGGTLPAFTVTVNDGSGVSNSTNSASATPVVQIVNDQPTISVTKTDPTEDSTTTSTVVGQVSASADEETATGDLTYTVATTGDTVYYVMSGTNVLLNDAGVALVNAGGTLPAFTVTVNDGSGVSNSTNSASATPVVQIVNDQPTISVTKTDPTEDSTTTSTVVGQVSASADEETATGDLTYTVATTGDTVYYVMSGTNVLLNDAGVALVNAGGTLPAFTVTVNDGSGVSNSTNSASATPVVQIVNDQPTISVTKTDPTEDSTTTSTVVGQVSASADEETATGDLTYTVATTGDTVYYVMSGTNVLLNDAGVALVNAGGTLPAFTVTVNDGSGVSNSTNSASATPVVQIVNDQPTISVTKTDPTEDSTTTSTVVGQVSASADEETATGDLTYTVATTGDTVYYVMSGTNVLLNDAGVALVNAGGTLPAFTVTVNDGSGVSNSTNSASATPVVQIVNDQPTISVTKTDPTEDSTTTSTVVGQVSASADEETATGDLTYTVATTGDTVYYVMSGTNVLLNDAGVALVNAGGTLPAFTVTVNDGSGVSNSTNSASATPVVQIVNDQPTISVTKTDPTEDSTTTSTVVGQVSASADEETATGDLTYTVATTGDTVYYVMSGTNVLLNDAGVALVNAGGTLPAFTVTVNDGSGVSNSTNSASATPVVQINTNTTVEMADQNYIASSVTVDQNQVTVSSVSPNYSNTFDLTADYTFDVAAENFDSSGGDQDFWQANLQQRSADGVWSDVDLTPLTGFCLARNGKIDTGNTFATTDVASENRGELYRVRFSIESDRNVEAFTVSNQSGVFTADIVQIITQPKSAGNLGSGTLVFSSATTVGGIQVIDGTHGTLIVKADGTYTYEADPGKSGSEEDSFTYTDDGVASTLQFNLGAIGSEVDVSTNSVSADGDVIGTTGADTIDESAAELAQIMLGLDGNDSLTGSDFNDLVMGGSGNDSLTGGDGSDVFKFTQSDIGGTDTITDFDFSSIGDGGDIVDLTDILDNTAANAKTFITFTDSGSDLVMTLDVNGSTGGTDTHMTITFTGEASRLTSDVTSDLLVATLANEGKIVLPENMTYDAIVV